MNFYYDTILGLQYTYLYETIVLDIDSIPKDFNLQEFIEAWKKTFNLHWDTGINFYPQIEVINKITNYKL